MEIVDAQIHPVEPAAEWGPDWGPEQAISASAELALASMDAVGVSAAIVSSRLESVLGYVDRCPARFTGLPFVGWPAPEPAVPVEEHVAKLASTEGIIGIRVVIGRADLFAVYESGGFDRCFAAADEHGLPVFLLAHGFLPRIHDLLRAYPDTTFVLDHVGLKTPPVNAEPGPDVLADLPDVIELARFPNVAVKFTGVPSLSVAPYPFSDVWGPMHRLIDAFGVDRLMWGSDFTRCKPLHTYREAVDFLLFTSEVSEAEKEMLFSGSIRRWLGWPPPQAAPAEAVE